MRRLKRTTLAGGVVYPAGTAETEELAQRVTNPDSWDDGDAVYATPSAVIDDDAFDGLDESEKAALQAIADGLESLHNRLDAIQADVDGHAERLDTLEQADGEGTPDETTGDPSDSAPAQPPAAPISYDGWSKDQLEAEIERRNAEQDRQQKLTVDKPGNKPDLLAALNADNAAQAAAAAQAATQADVQVGG